MSNRVRPTKSTSGGRTRPEPSSADRGRGRLPIWLPITILVAVVVVIAVVVVASGDDDDAGTATSAGDGASSDLAFAEVEFIGEPLPPQPQAGADAAIGLVAPTVRGFGPDGVERIFGNGEPRAIMVVAHWCGACQAELDELNAFLAEGGAFPDGVDIQVVSTWTDPGRANYPPGEWLADNQWNHPTIVDDEDFTLAAGLGLQGTPMWIFVDAGGTVVDRTGALPGADLVSRMDALLA